MIRGFIFQFEEAVARVDSYQYAAYSRLCDELNFSLDPNDYELLKTLPSLRAMRLLMDIGNQRCTDEQLREYCIRKERYFIEKLSGLNEAILTPGINAFIRQAKAQDFRIAAVSQYPSVPFVLEVLHMSDLFTSVCAPAMSSDETAGDSLFSQAAENLGLKPSECIAFVSRTSTASTVRACEMKCIALDSTEAAGYSDYSIKNFLNLDAGILIRKTEGE